MKNNAISVEMAGLMLDSPLLLSSGVLGLSASSLKSVADAGAGAVTSKSCGLNERAGHKCPAVLPFEHGVLNAIGLANPGVDEMVKEIQEYKRRSKTPLIASIFGSDVDEFGVVTEKIVSARPDMIEVNVSCPNVASEFGVPFGADIDICSRITRLVKDKSKGIPITVKLTANCPSIARIAKACEDNGADAITAINSIGPGMIIDVNVRKPVLSNKVGGVSGACVLPVSVRCVWDIYRTVKIPIIGGGGVTKPADALQMIMAGATAVGVGSGLYKNGPELFEEINQGIKTYLHENKMTRIDSLIGAAHG